MSPQYDGNNFEGQRALPATMRGPGSRAGQGAHPQMPPYGEDINEHRETLGCDRRPSPSWGPGWIWDEVLLCHRWADDVLSDEERETVRRARDACALEEARA